MPTLERDRNRQALRELRYILGVVEEDFLGDSAEAIGTSRLLLRIMQNEGFRATPYEDPSGENQNIGYGTNISAISRSEAAILMVLRLARMMGELGDRVEKKYGYDVDNDLPISVQAALADMVYAHGVPRLMQYRKMWAALKRGDWSKAADEVLDSKWARTYKTRAQRAARLVRAASTSID